MGVADGGAGAGPSRGPDGHRRVSRHATYGEAKERLDELVVGGVPPDTVSIAAYDVRPVEGSGGDNTGAADIRRWMMIGGSGGALFGGAFGLANWVAGAVVWPPLTAAGFVVTGVVIGAFAGFLAGGVAEWRDEPSSSMFYLVPRHYDVLLEDSAGGAVADQTGNGPSDRSATGAGEASSSVEAVRP